MNKILVFAAAFALTCGVAMAGNQSNSSSSSSTASQSASAAMNAGNSQSVTFTAPAHTTQQVSENMNLSGSTYQHLDQTVRNVPNVNVSELTTSNDTCMGSVTAGGSAVGFGISFGKTYIDQNCVMLKNAQELWNMGMRAAALARLCMDKNNAKALQLTGFVCPQDKPKTAVADIKQPKASTLVASTGKTPVIAGASH